MDASTLALVWDPCFLPSRIPRVHVERLMLSTELKGLGKLLSFGVAGRKFGEGKLAMGLSPWAHGFLCMR